MKALCATPGLRQRAVSAVCAALCIALAPVAAVPAEPLEYAVKAAFIYNFAKFVEWPTPSSGQASEQDGVFVIGILGQDPFGGALDEMVAGKTVRDKKITVKRFSNIEDAMNSHIVFIGHSEKETIARIIKRLDGAPVLTVSDIGRFAELGGMIELVIDQNRVRFAINVAAVEQAGLKPSSQLLKLARIVTSPVKAKE
ncbi:MAG: YfiR family protein [Nitrospirae bacterium]|nr:YfiR family protein [Nitrospirota bacterium]